MNEDTFFNWNKKMKDSEARSEPKFNNKKTALGEKIQTSQER